MAQKAGDNSHDCPPPLPPPPSVPPSVLEGGSGYSREETHGTEKHLHLDYKHFNTRGEINETGVLQE